MSDDRMNQPGAPDPDPNRRGDPSGVNESWSWIGNMHKAGTTIFRVVAPRGKAAPTFEELIGHDLEAAGAGCCDDISRGDPEFAFFYTSKPLEAQKIILAALDRLQLSPACKLEVAVPSIEVWNPVCTERE